MDALIILPFYMFMVMKKLIKEMYVSRGLNHRDMTRQLYMDNNLDINLLRYFLADTHSATIALISGGMLPWVPFVIKQGLGNTIKSGLNPFYDHV